MSDVEHKSERVKAHLTLREATGRDGLLRSSLASKARGLYQDDAALWFMAYYFHPACVSCVADGALKVGKRTYTPANIRELSFDDFIDLPETLINAWADEAFRKNPHWSPEPLLTPAEQDAQEAEKEKKTDQ